MPWWALGLAVGVGVGGDEDGAAAAAEAEGCAGFGVGVRAGIRDRCHWDGWIELCFCSVVLRVLFWRWR